MSYVVKNEDGQYYAGVEKGKVVWYKPRKKEVLLDQGTAELVLKQLEMLGHTGLRICNTEDEGRGDQAPAKGSA